MPNFLSLFSRWENLGAALILTVAAYLALFNLDYVTLWHDEGHNAVATQKILATGSLSGWDGRNLQVGLNGSALSDDLLVVFFPPLSQMVGALGVALLGDSEIGLRFPHALLGVLSMLIFWLLLRLDFADRPRLRLLALTFFALSAQALLFMRQGRYYGDAFFFALAVFYGYRCYWQSGRLSALALTATAAALGFFNHFAIGVSSALAVLSWHLIFHAQQTTRRQWLQFAAAGAVVTGVCLAYLVWAGIIGGDDQSDKEYGADLYQKDWLTRRFYLLFYYFRDTVKFYWFPFWVAVWWCGYAAWRIWQSWRAPGGEKKKKKKQKKARVEDNAAVWRWTFSAMGGSIYGQGKDDAAVWRWALMACLQVFFTAMLSVQTVINHTVADSRYMLAALPFFAFMTAVCVDSCWRWGRVWLAAPLAAVLLSTNVSSYPYIFPSYFTKEKVRWTLPSLVAEIHHPYPTAIGEIKEYLEKHAQQDDTILALPWQDNAILHYYLNDKLIFCCVLNDRSTLPRKKVRALGIPLYERDTLPVWQVTFGGQLRIAPDRYREVLQTKSYHYPIQRPELEYHVFYPDRHARLKEPNARLYLRDDVARGGASEQ